MSLGLAIVLILLLGVAMYGIYSVPKVAPTAKWFAHALCVVAIIAIVLSYFGMLDEVHRAAQRRW